MNIDQQVINRLDELCKQGKPIATPTSNPAANLVNSATTNESLWVLNCLDVLRRAFGPDSDYYKRFRDLYPEGEQVGGKMSTRPILA